jgi:pimeloyl-ACP methyl ester carboxylesterase
VLGFHGTADEIVSFSHAQALAERVPGAELVAIEGGEHVCLFTHRQMIRARLRDFLTDREEVRRTRINVGRR